MEKEAYIENVQKLNEKAKDFLRDCKLFGRKINLENNEEIIASLYVIVTTQSRQTRDNYANWKLNK